MLKNTPLRRSALLRVLIPLAILILTGCSSDERALQIAREAADRQAQQNHEIAHQNGEIAETTKRLVDADGQSRVELVALQRDLQTQLADVAKQRDALEAERRQQAAKRLTESTLAPVIETLGGVLVCALIIGFCCYLARGLRTDSDANPEINELLVMDLVSERPLLMPPFPPQGASPERLPGPVIVPDQTK